MSDIDYSCFDDVLLEPQFSHVKSRQDVNPSTEFLGLKLSIPVTNSNMDTVASPRLSLALHDYGAVSSIHRFCTIEENVKLFKDSISNNIKPIVSVGVGTTELDRAAKLVEAGAEIILLDVAHAANILVVAMYQRLAAAFPNCKIIVGNFGTSEEIRGFITLAGCKPAAICVGIGGGSMCLTRVVTGVGIPTLGSIMACARACKEYDMKMMVNGGIRNSGDVVKALAAGADLVMLGSMFAGTDEASGRLCEIHRGESCEKKPYVEFCGNHKEYRGSASIESYEAQGKIASWRAPEGDSTWVDLKGPAVKVLNNINGGIRSACSYLNAFNIDELKQNASFIYVSSNTVVENGSHGKKN